MCKTCQRPLFLKEQVEGECVVCAVKSTMRLYVLTSLGRMGTIWRVGGGW